MSIDWKEIESWDRKYYLHNVFAHEEYDFTAIERVDGNYLYLANGAKLLDFQSQLISDGLGHRHPAPHRAIEEAMKRYGHVFFGFATDYRARAAKLIIEDLLGGESSWASRVRILTSGGEAVENAIQMARLATNRPIVLTQAHSFHGLAQGATRLPGYRGNLSHIESEITADVPGYPGSTFHTIPAPEHQTDRISGELPSISETRAIIEKLGAEHIAAVITEPMFGAAGWMPHPDYYPQLRALMNDYGILWIDDEVLCGCGRLGKWFGYQLNDNISPDLMTIGKALNGCSLPSGAVVVSEKIGDLIENARWWSGSTWDAHPLVCASIVGTLEFMLETDLLTQINARGQYLKAALDELAARHPSIGRIGGAGLYYAVDLVDAHGEPIVKADRDYLFTGDLSENPNNLVSAACAQRGVFLGGFVPNTIKCGPPYTITEQEIDLAMGAFDEALSLVEAKYH